MRKSPELRLLEVGVNPDFVERADRHESLANLDIVARIDVSARDDPVDLGDDIAVAEIKLGLGEIALGDLEGLSLLDVRAFAASRAKTLLMSPSFSNAASI